MKFVAIVLLATLAVSNAAFTANLVQRTQPIINEAMFKLRLSTGRGDELQTSLFQQLQAEATQLAQQIQDAVAHGYAVSQEAVQHLSDLQAQMTSLVSGAASSVVDVLGSFWSNITGTLGNLFNWGRSGLISGLFDNVAQAFNAYMNNLLQQAQEMVNNFNLPNLLNQALNHIVGQITGRGLFGNMLDAISQAGSNAWNAITGIFNNAVSVAGSAFNTAQAMAQEFVTEATGNIHAITTDAANDFLDFLKPYAQDLGTLYDQVAGIVSQIGN